MPKAMVAKVLYSKLVNKPKVIVPSKAPKNSNAPEYEFRGWKYTTTSEQFSNDQQAQVHNIYLDTGCTITLIDKDFLKKVAPNAVIKKMASPVSVRGVRPKKHALVNYTTINLYFPRNKHCTAAIYQKVHVVNGLKAKMHIGINILGRESFTIDTGNKKAIIGSCNNIIITLEVAPQAHMQFTQQILANKDTTIPVKTLGQISLRNKLPKRKDLLSEPSYAKLIVTVFAQIVGCRMTKMLMQNDTNNALTIAGRTQLKQVIKYEADACYQVHIDTVGTAPINAPCSAL